MGKRVPKTRNGKTWTESQYWSAVSSVLRRGFRYWKPITQCRINSRRLYKGSDKRRKWEYQCNHCKKWFKGSEVQVDHIVPVGKLRSYEDLADMLKRLTPENGFQVLCKPCHQIKTNKERK